MKRTTSVFILAALLLSSAPVFSAPPGTAEYERMKAYKAEQRKLREERKAAGPSAEKKAPGFWDREAERSGLAQTGGGVGNVFKNMNPVPFFKEQRERYEARKAAAGSK